jgi:ATP-dependent protease ClpP protease subunit
MRNAYCAKNRPTATPVTSVHDDADFSSNPDRSLRVDDRLDEALLKRLMPEIIALVTRSREPITLFLDSPGGYHHVAEALLSILRWTVRGDRQTPCRIITVAAPKAESAAAGLLSAGDFAIASPRSKLLYHGGRWPVTDHGLTGEWERAARRLPSFHEAAAAALARNSVHRFLFIVSACRSQFAQHRADQGDPTPTDMDCFHAILREKLSPAAQNVLDLAIPLSACQNGLLLHFQKKLRRGRTVTEAQLQKLMLYTGMSFEFENANGVAWEERLSRISDHFHFLNAYFDVGRLHDWVVALSTPETDTDVEDDYFLPFRMFFLALCRALQEGENSITAHDAIWLGLIDTVSDGPTGSRESS